jgi:hypothetical protein
MFSRVFEPEEKVRVGSAYFYGESLLSPPFLASVLETFFSTFPFSLTHSQQLSLTITTASSRVRLPLSFNPLPFLSLNINSTRFRSQREKGLIVPSKATTRLIPIKLIFEILET